MNGVERLGAFSYFLLAFKKYAQFSGRSTRSEYWYFQLFFVPLFIFQQIFVQTVTQIDKILVATSFGEGGASLALPTLLLTLIALLIALVFNLGMLLPNYSPDLSPFT